MKKDKISRKEFITRTSKIAGGLILCPSVIAVLQSCSSDPVSSESPSNGLFSECPCHNARFDVDGIPIQGPATEPLLSYSYELTDNQELIIDGALTIDVSDLDTDSALMLEANEVDGSGLLIYKKTDIEFNVLSRECTHQACPVGAFQ